MNRYDGFTDQELEAMSQGLGCAYDESTAKDSEFSMQLSYQIDAELVRRKLARP